jgi:hypothetical protein
MPKVRIKRIPPGFDKNVFINCPFDEKYMPLFRAVIFTVHDMGFRSRCTLEASNAGNVRIDKIQNIIGQCKYSIHDLSRTQLDRTHRLPRFNMPLELGIDLGCKRFGKGHEQEKVVLVMDIERFRYQRFISDIAGQDVYAHGGTQSGIVNEVREWLRPELDPKRFVIPSGAEVLGRFRAFKKALPAICARLHSDPDRLGFVEYAYAVASWITGNPL